MIVLDAGIVLALVLPLSFSDEVASEFRSLRASGEELFAPSLLEYEVCSALRRAETQRVLEAQETAEAIDAMRSLGIQTITPAESLHRRALRWSERLFQTKAYDAQYLALAEEMNCELLTTDRRLARAASQLGATWVRTPAPRPVPSVGDTP